jgi:uncharacterized protein YndB with AHSA1/START domain
MTTPDVPLRMELAFEMPGTPAQVWDAVATANGISSWFLPTDVEEREGGSIAFHMGPDASSEGTITGWEPPVRLAYVEPAWAALSGHDTESVTPLATEFLVEAQSGGTCVVRVVSSAFGTGADWEGEFFAEMERMWLPFFDRLRLYLTHFPGQRVTQMEVNLDVSGDPSPLWAAMRAALPGVEEGQPFQVRDLIGRVESVGDVQMLVRLTDPVPGMLAFVAFATGEDTARASVQGHLFSAGAPAFVERERAAWREWLDGLGVAVSER